MFCPSKNYSKGKTVNVMKNPASKDKRQPKEYRKSMNQKYKCFDDGSF